MNEFIKTLIKKRGGYRVHVTRTINEVEKLNFVKKN